MRDKIIIFYFLFLSISGNSQTTYFNNRYDFGNFYEGSSNIVEINDGYVILGEAVDSMWYYHLGIMKINKEGNVIWKKLYWKPGYNYGGGLSSLIKTNDSCLVNAGMVWDTTGKYFVELRKFDLNGDSLWTKKYSCGFNQGCSSYQCKQTLDSGYILIGYSDAVDVNGDILLIKTDPSGNLQWEKTYGGGGVEYGFTVDVCFDGGYILGGYTESFGAGMADIFIIKTNSLGSNQWDTTFGGQFDDGTVNIIQTSDSGYFIGGGLGEYILSGSYAQRMLYLIKLNKAGKLEWNKTYGPIRYLSGITSVHELPDGSFVTAGQSSNNKGTPNGNGWPIGVILKLNSEGDSIWYREHEYDTCAKNFDYFRDMKPTADGGFIVAGFFTPRTYEPCNDTGTQDMWVIKLDSCGCAYLGCDSACQGLVAINEKYKIINEKLQIQPNPTTGKFVLEMLSGAEEEKQLEIRIYDVLGTAIKQIKAKSQKIDVDMSEYSAGVYFIQIKNETDSYSSRVVKY